VQLGAVAHGPVETLVIEMVEGCEKTSADNYSHEDKNYPKRRPFFTRVKRRFDADQTVETHCQHKPEDK
jgi:hypothetical protein